MPFEARALLRCVSPAYDYSFYLFIALPYLMMYHIFCCNFMELPAAKHKVTKLDLLLYGRFYRMFSQFCSL